MHLLTILYGIIATCGATRAVSNPGTWGIISMLSLTKSQVLFVIPMLRTDFSWLSPTISKVSQEHRTGYGNNRKYWHHRAPARAHFLSYTCRALQDQGRRYNVLSYSLSINAVIIVAICDRTKLVESCGAQRHCYFLGRLHWDPGDCTPPQTQ